MEANNQIPWDMLSQEDIDAIMGRQQEAAAAEQLRGQLLDALYSRRSPEQASWEPKPGEVDAWERTTGSDWSMDVSPRERNAWFNDPEMGYGGDIHNQYARDAESLLDEPLIPEEYVDTVAPLAKMSGGYESGDMTLRQFITAAPQIAQWAAFSRAVKDPTPENKQAYMALDAINRQAKEELPEGADAMLANPISSAAWDALTGRAYDRNNQYATDVAMAVIQGLGSGRTNSRFENDPSISDSDYAKLREQYGDEADRMLTDGGKQNAKREMAYDFFSALQNGQEFTPHLDNMSMAMAAAAPGATATPGEPFRFLTLMQPSAMQGRMQFASNRLKQARQSFEGQDPQKPYVFQAQNFNRTDPGSFSGLYNLAGNSSFKYGQMQNAFEPIAGELLSRSQLLDGPLDTKPLQFFQETNDRAFREAPRRPDGMSPAEFGDTRNFAMDRRRAGKDYLDTFKPGFVDWYNANVVPVIPQQSMQRTYPTGIGSAAMNFVPGTAKSIAQTGMTLASFGAGSAVAGAANAARVFPLEMAKEALIEEPIEEAVTDPRNASSMFDFKQDNAWMRPLPPGSLVDGPDGSPRRRSQREYERMLDPRNKAEWDRGVQETNDQRTVELGREYGKWKRSR